MIYRLGLKYQTSYPIFGKIGDKQFLWWIISMCVVILIMFIINDYRVLRKLTYTSFVFGIILLILPMFPVIGVSTQGSRVWINLFGLSMQPAEFAKILLAIFFAGYLVSNRDTLALAGPKFLGIRFPRLKDFGPILIVWVLSLALLILERDLGTSILFFGLFVAMLYIATNRPSWLAIGGIMFLLGVVTSYIMFGHVRARFDAWLHPFSNELYNKAVGGSAQLVKGLFGLANGGLFGTGLGLGRPDITDLAFSDYIYTSFAEELGLIGISAIMICLLILISRGLVASIKVRDSFGKLLIAGLSFGLFIQVFVVVGGETRVIPVTGMTLPFMASGGSSLLANWIIVALLLKISNSANRPTDKSIIELGLNTV
jgi:cell division protein FtsW (lipid II flippase)